MIAETPILLITLRQDIQRLLWKLRAHLLEPVEDILGLLQTRSGLYLVLTSIRPFHGRSIRAAIVAILCRLNEFGMQIRHPNCHHTP